MAQAPIFAGLERRASTRLADAAKTRNYLAGDVLVKEGSEAVAFYVLSTGEAEVIKGLGQADEVALGRLKEGDFFGEMALLDGFQRSASVRAITDCECVVLIRWDFVAVLKRYPGVALEILSVMSHRLRDCESRLLP